LLQSPPDALGLIWVAVPEPDTTPVKHLGRLFDLTRAEQHLLCQLAEGDGLRDAAAHLHVSIHTARNQLKSILRKTGRHTQTQLLTLVTRMAALRIPDTAYLS
jgi:DNA-binding CsgD family transcriptional regulator